MKSVVGNRRYWTYRERVGAMLLAVTIIGMAVSSVAFALT
jgi:hypothetical protein